MPLKSVPINYETCVATELPCCPRCKCKSHLRTIAPMRPNILMFDDPDWMDQRSMEQEARFYQFMGQIEYFLFITHTYQVGVASNQPHDR